MNKLWNLIDLTLNEKDIPRNILNEYGDRLIKDTDGVLRYDTRTMINEHNCAITRFNIRMRDKEYSFSPFSVKVDILSATSYPCELILDIEDDPLSITCKDAAELRKSIEATIQNHKMRELLTKIYNYATNI